MARIARIVPRPAIAETNVDRPVATSQMPNNNMPVLFVNLILVSFL